VRSRGLVEADDRGLDTRPAILPPLTSADDAIALTITRDIKLPPSCLKFA